MQVSEEEPIEGQTNIIDSRKGNSDAIKCSGMVSWIISIINMPSIFSFSIV